MNSKPDNKCENRDGIVFLSEIITNSIYWQGVSCNYSFESSLKHSLYLLF